MADEGSRDGGIWWRIERIEEREKDILGKIDHLNAKIDLLTQRSDERGWKMDAVFIEIQRGLREIKEAVERKAVLSNPDLVKILVTGLIALAGGNFAVKALVGVN